MDVELFGAAGGMGEGFRRAGLAPKVVVELDPDHAASYERNLGVRPLLADVHDLVAGGWSPGPVELLVADPPCTPWSNAGKRRGLADERDCLLATCELVRRLQPHLWLVANVPGLETTPNWPAVQRTIGGLASDYCIDYFRLDAADYGVPQHRVRPFWVGHRRGTPCVTPPPPTHGPPGEQVAIPGCQLHPWVTCAEALAHLPDEELGRPVRLRWKERSDHRPSRMDEPAQTLLGHSHSDGSLILRPNHPPSSLDKPAMVMRGSEVGGRILTLTRGHEPSDPAAPSRVIGARVYGNGGQSMWIRELGRPSTTGTAQVAPPGKGSPGSRRWPWDRPATTVVGRGWLGHPGHHDCATPQFGGDAVVISERAGAILQGFPEGWIFVGATKAKRWSQIGQAMPPPLAEAVARSVVLNLDHGAST